VRLVALHHRLSTFGGHRYYEGLGLVDESRRRGWDLNLLVSEYAREPVLHGLGSDARSVLCHPCVDDLEALTRAAATCAGPWRETQSLGSFLDAMEQLRSGRL
jgi:nitrate reductase beta subunit